MEGDSFKVVSAVEGVAHATHEEVPGESFDMMSDVTKKLDQEDGYSEQAANAMAHPNR